MIHPCIFAGAFISREVPRILHDHDRRVISLRVTADRADLGIGQILAVFAVMNVCLGVCDRFGKAVHPLG